MARMRRMKRVITKAAPMACEKRVWSAPGYARDVSPSWRMRRRRCTSPLSSRAGTMLSSSDSKETNPWTGSRRITGPVYRARRIGCCKFDPRWENFTHCRRQSQSCGQRHGTGWYHGKTVSCPWTEDTIRVLLGSLGKSIESTGERRTMARDTDERAEGGLKALRLVDVLRALPPRELRSLVSRLKLRIDEAKRIDPPSQVARALVALPEARDPSQLPGPTRELLYRIAEAKGVLVVEGLPPAVEPLVARGIVYARARGGGEIELVLPIAFIVQLRSWEGDDPRGARALYLGQYRRGRNQCGVPLSGPAGHPAAFAVSGAGLGGLARPHPAGGRGRSPGTHGAQAAPRHREGGRRGGHRGAPGSGARAAALRGATGATPSRRGVGFALERRGFLIPVHPNRHVIPSEVANIVGAQRRAEREAQRREIRSYVLGEDHAPRRARFSDDPVPLVLALALAVRDPEHRGAPRRRHAALLGEQARDSLRRGSRRGGAARRALPGHGSVGPVELGRCVAPGLLSRCGLRPRAVRGLAPWRRLGRSADPTARCCASLREAREASAVGVLRAMVIDALRELSDGRWAPWEALAAYVRADSRTPGLARLLERWAVARRRRAHEARGRGPPYRARDAPRARCRGSRRARRRRRPDLAYHAPWPRLHRGQVGQRSAASPLASWTPRCSE